MGDISVDTQAFDRRRCLDAENAQLKAGERLRVLFNLFGQELESDKTNLRREPCR
jgi:hypothetical protein